MPSRRPVGDFDVTTVARQAIGGGNYVILGDAVIGPISIDKPETKGSELLLAGASAISPVSGERLSADQAFARLAASVKRTERELVTDLTEARHQSRVFFTLLCAFSAVGFCLVLVAIALVLLGRVQSGVISTAASAVAELLALVFSRKDHELRVVIESYHAHLVSYCQFLTMIDVAETIVGETERDALKSKIICALLSAKPEAKTGPRDNKD